jgi:hypothetical protein
MFLETKTCINRTRLFWFILSILEFCLYRIFRYLFFRRKKSFSFVKTQKTRNERFKKEKEIIRSITFNFLKFGEIATTLDVIYVPVWYRRLQVFRLSYDRDREGKSKNLMSLISKPISYFKSLFICGFYDKVGFGLVSSNLAVHVTFWKSLEKSGSAIKSCCGYNLQQINLFLLKSHVKHSKLSFQSLFCWNQACYDKVTALQK